MEREEGEKKEKVIVPAGSRALKKYQENIEIVTASSADTLEVDPYTYLEILWRHRRIAFIFFITVVLATLMVSVLTKPMYKATSTVEIALQKPQVVGFQDVIEINTRDPEFFNTQRDLISSRAMAEAVLSKFGLWEHPDFYTFQPDLNPISVLFSYAQRMISAVVEPIEGMFEQDSENNNGDEAPDMTMFWEKIKGDRVITTFLSRVAVSPSDDSRLIHIQFEAYSPQFAAKMADAIADTFVEWSSDRRLEATRTAREFLQKQLEEVKADLATSEHVLYQFLAIHDIVGLDKDMNLIYRQLDELQRSLAQTATEKTTKESIYKAVKSGNPDTTMEVINDPQIQNLKRHYNDLLIQYSDLSALFKPEYPPLKKLQAQIDGVRTRLNEETKSRIAAIEADYQTASHKEELLKERVKEQEVHAMTLNQKTIQYNILDREVQTNKSIYDSLLQRLKETDVTGGVKSTGIQVVDHAFIPMTPFKPDTPRNLVLGVLAGLMGAVGIAFLREFFDRTIKTPEEIREKMQLPVLGSVFKLDAARDYGKVATPTEKLYLADPKSPFSEAIRTIRASVMLSSKDRSIHSVLVTSCWPGEGKSTVASNLAISMAYGTNRVLLVEADLRHPGVAGHFGIDQSKPGLSNYLMSHANMGDIIYSTEVPQLFVLPCGSSISNPSELLQSGIMEELLEKLKEKYDYVIIDSSPAIGLADSLVISSVVDATVVVASTGVTMRRDISYLVKQMTDINARFLGVVVNRVQMGRENYHYYDRYYKSYYTKDVRPTRREGFQPLNESSAKNEFDEVGELDKNAYASLLISYLRDKRTGILSIDSKLKLRIYFLEGFPVFVEGGDSKTRLGNIAFAERKIRRDDYARVLEKVARTKKKIGEVLIEMGFISPHELDWLLEFQVKEKLVRGFECTTGSYGFQSISDFVDSILTYKVNPLQVVYEGIKRYLGPMDVEKEFFFLERRVLLSSEPEVAENLKNVGFSPREFRFLQHLSRNNVIDDLASINLLPREDMLRLVYFLRTAGFVKLEILNDRTGSENVV